MKIAACLILALSATACTAQTPPVVLAHSLYRSCVQGLVQARGLPEKRADIQAEVTYLDTFCAQWTAAWYPAFEDKKRPGLTAEEHARFFQMRQHIRQQISDELKKVIPR